MKSLYGKGSDTNTLNAIFKVEDFTVPLGRLSKVYMTIDFANDFFKNRFIDESGPKESLSIKSIPGEIEVGGILPQADYRPILKLLIRFDDGDQIMEKPSTAEYGCPGIVNMWHWYVRNRMLS